MARSIYDTLNEMNNRPVRNVTVIDNNGNVTKTNSKALKKAKSKNVKEDVKPISSLDSLTDAVENILI
jgi:hypothetical protein|tara:strand:+ start:235 stop:438 length:204 start_codon:yes stop_codon:yes gene_type:complete